MLGHFTAVDVAMIERVYADPIATGEAMLRERPERMSPSRRLWRAAEAGDQEAIATLALQVFEPGADGLRAN